MRKKSFLVAALTVCLCVSCEKELEVGNGGGAGSGDQAFVNISLNLPADRGTRAAAGDGTGENGNVNDGLPEEFEVKNTIVAIFAGETEANATFYQAVSLDGAFQGNGNPTDQITSTYQQVLTLVKPEEDQNLFALAILNNNGLFQVVQGEEEGKMKLQWKASASADFSDFTGTYNRLQEEYALNVAAVTGEPGGFLMLNAPQAAVLGNQDQINQAVSTLVPVEYYDTEAAAEAAQADPIYVERVVAKATVKVKSENGNLTIADGYYAGATVSFEGWKLNTTNKSTFLLRNVSDWSKWKDYKNTSSTATENRFFGLSALPTQVYWGIDPNYGVGESAEGDFNSYKPEDASISWNSLANTSTEDADIQPEYCLENTTVAEEMTKNVLTGVILKAKFTPKDATAESDFFVLGRSSTVYTKDQFIAMVNKVLGEGTITSVNTDGEGKNYKTAEEVAAWLQITPEQAETLLASPTFNGGIKFYKGGVTYYYSTIIKHFGDYYTPYNGDKNNVVYNDNDHLGRYGMLRNNWYEIVIRSVSGPGEPEIPTEPEIPVDKENAYINVSINVLPWTVRRQEVDL